MSLSAPEDAFLDVNDAHLRVYGNVHADGLKLGQLEIVTTTSTGSTIQFLHQHTAFTTTSNIEVGTTNHDLFVDTNASKVGVLTNTPTTALDVNGTVKATAFDGDGALLTGIPSSAINGTLSQWTTVTGPKIHYSDGNVGIGIADPLHTLDVVGDINFTGTLREDGNPFVSTPWTIESGPTALSYTLGNVGVGGTTPSAKLEVTGNAHVSTDLSVGGNLTINTISAAATHGLGAVTALSNTSADTVLLTNTGTSLVASGAVQAVSFTDGTETLTGGTWSGSAATLTTPRTIGGVPFDGSAAIVPTTFGAATFSGDVTVDTTTFHVDTTNNRVGIGTTSPSTDLQIGNTTDKTSDTYLTIASDGGSAYAQGIKLIHHHSNYGWRIRGDDTDDCFHINYISAGSNNASALIISNTGQILAPFNLKMGSGNVTAGAGLRFIQQAPATNWWDLGMSTNTDPNFVFSYRGGAQGYLNHGAGNSQLNFTGQHRTFIKDTPFTEAENLEGLIVSADQNKYIKMSGGIEAGSNAITVNESLPLVSLSVTTKDKKCFGVISTSEDPEKREEEYGNWVSVSEKEKGDTRVFINSVGEGAIWVVNTNGSLESGDYITTSTVKGYGQKQDDDILHNYTVAKITMDCDFDPATQPVQMIKKDQDGENVLDEHDQIQWEDHPTESEKAYKIRYLDANGVITDEASAVHKAAFVGCTYHCG